MSYAPFRRNECKFTKGKRERNASYFQKCIYLWQIKVTDSCSASQNLPEKYVYMSQCEMGVQVTKKYRNLSPAFIALARASLHYEWVQANRSTSQKNVVCNPVIDGCTNVEISKPQFHVTKKAWTWMMDQCLENNTSLRKCRSSLVLTSAPLISWTTSGYSWKSPIINRPECRRYFNLMTRSSSLLLVEINGNKGVYVCRQLLKRKQWVFFRGVCAWKHIRSKILLFRF